MKYVRTIFLTIFCILSACPLKYQTCVAQDVTPLPQSLSVMKEMTSQVTLLSGKIKTDADAMALFSARGDAHFFLGNFPEAVADYTRMVELNSEIDKSHWRRGIAYFYNKEFDKAAAQFERYHAFDNVDRENGIWRYFSMYKAQGAEQARQELLKYEKDDREPFPDVYQLFANQITPQELIQKIELPQKTEEEREKRRFYGYLYLGLNEAITGQPEDAMKYLRNAVENKWGEQAGYGPNYMWHVGRLQLEALRASQP